MIASTLSKSIVALVLASVIAGVATAISADRSFTNALFVISLFIIIVLNKEPVQQAGFFTIAAMMYVVAYSILLNLAILIFGFGSNAIHIAIFPLDKLGYYPQGADIPLFARLAVWGVCIMIISIAIFIIGSMLRTIYDRTSRRSSDFDGPNP